MNEVLRLELLQNHFPFLWQTLLPEQGLKATLQVSIDVGGMLIQIFVVGLERVPCAGWKLHLPSDIETARR